MGWESSGVVGFDLGPLLQGQTRIAKVNSAYNSLIIAPRSLQYETNSWARNFLMLDLTLGPSFKVKQWFTGFGELSFRWIQICIGLGCVGLVNILSLWEIKFFRIRFRNENFQTKNTPEFVAINYIKDGQFCDKTR